VRGFVGLLVTAVIWALFVAMAVWFPFRRGPLGFAVFALTMACNEIPLILLVVFVASVVASLGDAATDSSAALAALGVALLVALGFAWLQVRARRVSPAFEAALSADLSPEWRATIRLEFRIPLLPTTPWLRGILLPFERHSRTVERVRNIPYAPGGRAHLLDIYRRKESGIGRPILIHLHSGGFVQGGKSREGITLLNQLADHGWLCVSANYSLRSEGVFPHSLVDTKRVIAWARAHAGEYGADPEQIFLAGGSAGGHLAISAALTAGDPRFQPGFEQVDTRVCAAVVMYGYLGPRSADAASSPASLARPDAPPILILHGAKDTAVPPAGARSVAASLRSVSRSAVVYAELPDTQHGFDFLASVRARTAANAVEAFLGWVRSRPRDDAAARA
jgi:acetyl esterase/lipase